MAIERATFDILDAAIPEFNQWQNEPDEKRFMPYRRAFLTDPVYWVRHKPDDWAFALNWDEFQYSAVTTPGQIDARIQSNEPGVYVFYVRPENVIHHFPRFAFYIGISNERESGRALRDRLKDYLPARIRNKRKRDNIDQMLQMYYGVLWVSYALITRSSAEMVELEKKLHGFIYPCYPRRDFPDDIRTQQRRFGVI